eukprot:snap_masked-scaffold_39-processed-gene-0.4-mRNA-1 protein AED:1.00 eAED:1.00 QI:0/0/0/0/1/1/3/0/342
MNRQEVSCELPYLQEDGKCETTLFNYYDPFLTWLRVLAIFEYGLLLLMFIATLFVYIRSHLKNISSSGRPATERQNLFFRYNVGCLLFSALGMAGILFYSYNDFLLTLDVSSEEGKSTVLGVFIGCNCLFESSFLFLPVLKEIMGSFTLTEKEERTFYMGIRAGLAYPIFSSVVLYLLGQQSFTFSFFLTYCFLSFLPQTVLLLCLLLQIVDTVLDGLYDLKQRYEENSKVEGSSIRKNSLANLCVKLNRYLFPRSRRCVSSGVLEGEFNLRSRLGGLRSSVEKIRMSFIAFRESTDYSNTENPYVVVVHRLCHCSTNNDAPMQSYNRFSHLFCIKPGICFK